MKPATRETGPSGSGARAMSSDDLRQRLGFPAGANRWLRLLLYPALTPMFILRHKVGVRMATVTRLLGAYCFLLLWGAAVAVAMAAYDVVTTKEMPSIADTAKGMLPEVAPSRMLPDWVPGWARRAAQSLDPAPKQPEPARPTFGGLWSAFAEKVATLWQPLATFGLLTLVLGAGHRVVRWIHHLRGEQLNTKSLGISWVQLPLAKDTVERYIDPLLCMVVGGMLVGASPAGDSRTLLGWWIVFCGIALAVVEKYVHEIQLDQYDALLSAQAHEQITASYLSGLRPGAGQAQPRRRRPIPTGMSQDVRDRMARRLASQGLALPVMERPAVAGPAPAAPARPAQVAYEPEPKLAPVVAPVRARPAPPHQAAAAPTPAPAPLASTPPMPVPPPPPSEPPRPSRPSSNSLFD